jgi:hypothetical protein
MVFVAPKYATNLQYTDRWTEPPLGPTALHLMWSFALRMENKFS